MARRVRRGLAALAVACVTIAALVVYAPGALPAAVVDRLTEAIAGVPLGLLVAGLAGVGFVFALWKLLPTPSADAFESFADTMPEEPVADGPVVGGEFNDRFEGGATGNAVRPTLPADDLRDELRGRAVRAYRASENCPRDAAVDAVENGTWTDARVPAAFLGGAAAPRFTLLERLHAWLYPHAALKTRASATLVAVHALLGDSNSTFVARHTQYPERETRRARLAARSKRGDADD